MGGELSGLAGLPFAGATRQEALENIKTAIREWLQVEAEEDGIVSAEVEQV
jgi:predicted RNase H-like HicB family nuclease